MGRRASTAVIGVVPGLHRTFRPAAIRCPAYRRMRGAVTRTRRKGEDYSEQNSGDPAHCLGVMCWRGLARSLIVQFDRRPWPSAVAQRQAPCPGLQLADRPGTGNDSELAPGL